MRKSSSKDDQFALLWGAESIAAELGVAAGTAYHLLRTGRLRGAAKKIGPVWVAERGKLRALFLEDEEAADARATAA